MAQPSLNTKMESVLTDREMLTMKIVGGIQLVLMTVGVWTIGKAAKHKFVR